MNGSSVGAGKYSAEVDLTLADAALHPRTNIIEGAPLVLCYTQVLIRDAKAQNTLFLVQRRRFALRTASLVDVCVTDRQLTSDSLHTRLFYEP